MTHEQRIALLARAISAGTYHPQLESVARSVKDGLAVEAQEILRKMHKSAADHRRLKDIRRAAADLRKAA